MHFSQWLSPKFAVWASKTLRHIIEGNYQALTSEAKEAQQQLQKIWNQLRDATKETFWFMADAIKAYHEEHPRQEKYNGQNYAEAFDTLNVGLFNKRAKTIKKELGISKGALNRDHFGKDALKRIEMIQRIAEAQIMSFDKHPVEAVQFALNVLNYDVIDYQQ